MAMLQRLGETMTSILLGVLIAQMILGASHDDDGDVEAHLRAAGQIAPMCKQVASNTYECQTSSARYACVVAHRDGCFRDRGAISCEMTEAFEAAPAAHAETP